MAPKKKTKTKKKPSPKTTAAKLPKAKKMVKRKPASPPSAPVPTPTQVAELLTSVSTTQNTAVSALATTLVPPEALAVKLPADVLVVVNAIKEFGARAKLLTITAENAKTAEEMLTQLKGFRTQLEAHRKALVKPIKDRVKRLEALFAPAETQLEEFDELMRQKYIEYRKALQLQQQQEQQTLLADAQKAQSEGDLDTALALATQSTNITGPEKTVVLETGSVQVKNVWTFEVTDLGKVPEEYKTLDETKVRAAIRAGMRDGTNEDGTPAPAIPGIRIFQREQVSVSAS